MNKLPAKAGRTKLISQMAEAVNTMPKVLALKAPNKKILILPLTPNSAKAIVGTIANARNMIVINQKAVTTLISTLNSCNNNKY
ncbi:MAG: hypothetical protein JWR18_4136 [Segetibacter sp.]|nr:hypothetical protein [Segetibacter sp.]